MSDFVARDEVSEWKSMMRDQIRSDFADAMKEWEDKRRAEEQVNDTLHEQCDPSWTIYASQAFRVAAEFYDDNAATALFNEYNDSNHDRDLGSLVSLFCHCLALSIAQDLLEEIVEEYEEYEEPEDDGEEDLNE